jgi:hypothetical protein
MDKKWLKWGTWSRMNNPDHISEEIRKNFSG